MNVILYGATGNSGSRILKELMARGHQVTAVVRDPTKLPAGVASKQGDLSNVDAIAASIAGADAVVSAYAPPPDNTDALVGAAERLVAAVKRAGNVRLILVGGAGLLEVAPGVSLLSSGNLPAAWVPIATSHSKATKVLADSDINWTYFSPAAYFEPGERTGKFRLGTKELVVNDKGESRGWAVRRYVDVLSGLRGNRLSGDRLPMYRQFLPGTLGVLGGLRVHWLCLPTGDLV